MRIYHYTGTGNSLWTARKLAERLGGAELINMKTARDPLIPEGCGRLGFVFPVHMFGLIGAVREFARRLEFGDGQARRPYLFAVAVNSGALVRTLVQLNRSLRPSGLSLQAGFAVVLLLTARMDRFFSVDETCSSCGICARVCPADNIELREGKPKWQHRCEQCLACLQWCPEEAIQFGKGTAGGKHYHHPQITLKDILDGRRNRP